MSFLMHLQKDLWQTEPGIFACLEILRETTDVGLTSRKLQVLWENTNKMEKWIIWLV